MPINKVNEFNELIWKDLLEYKKKYKKAPSTEEIVMRWLTSTRVAYAYRFALMNVEKMSLPLEALYKVGVSKADAESSKKIATALQIENDTLKAQVDFFTAIDILDRTDFQKIKVSQADMSIDENTAIALLSDAHCEETIESAIVNGLNEYNLDIAERRIKLYFKRLMFLITGFRKGGWNVENLVLAILGDLITGYIHEELMENNSLSPTEASLFIMDLLVAGIEFLVSEGDFKTIKIICARGNHGRTSVRKKFSTGYKNSYEWMMFTMLAKYFSNKPGYEHVEFIVSKSEFTRIQIYDKIWVVSHGDHFKYQGGVGGMMVPFNRWIGKMMKIIPADMYAIGHWHSEFTIPGGMSNGSIIGYSPFAMGNGFAPEPPQQQLQLQDSRRGFTVNTPIILTDWK